MSLFSSLVDLIVPPPGEPTLICVEYNVTTGPDGQLEARSRDLMLPANLSFMLTEEGAVTLSLRSWPLGRLDASFPEEPTDAELIQALLTGWESYADHAAKDDAEIVRLGARASAWRMW